MADQPVAEGHQPVSRRAGAILAGFGIVIASIGIGVGIKTWLFASSALEVEGTVIRMDREGSGSRITFAPVVTYEINGRAFQLRSDVSTSPPAYRVGDKVAVLYAADRPANGQIRSFSQQWVFPLLLSVFGMVLAGVGVSHLLRRDPSAV